MLDVIIPVYNTPIEDLKRCFESIIRQSYQDFKVTIIDDESNDEVLNFLNKYVTENTKFQVIHIKNAGVSNARNIGIEKTEAEFVTFLDADDEIEDDFFKEALEIMVNNNLDIVSGGIRVINGNKEIVNKCKEGVFVYSKKSEISAVLDYILTHLTNKKNMEFGNIMLGRVYPKVYKRKILNNIRFNNKVSVSEDNLFCIDLLNHCERIGIVSNIWYKYYQNNYSITHRKCSIRTINEEIVFAKEIFKRKEICNSTDENAFKIRLLWIFIIVFSMYLKLSKEERKKINILDIINSLPFSDTFNDVSLKEYINVTKREKIMYLVFCKTNKTIRNAILKFIMLIYRYK